MTTLIKYINQSMNKDLPQVFVFARNEVPTFDAITDGVAWRVISNIGRGSMASFTYDNTYSIRARWQNGANQTSTLAAQIGKRYNVLRNKTGIVIKQTGEANAEGTIELNSLVNVENGISAQLCNDNRLIMGKKIVGYQQSAVFKPGNKIYWGLASSITEGKGLGTASAVLNSNSFFELELSGVAEVVVSLNGNAENGYYFEVEEQT
ncbi:MAG: hypothetical protein ACJAXJ_003971 [Colwellia sp.]|jgi:hypothetical protein